MVIKVERGRPTPEELAAVVALVQARAAAIEAEQDGPAGRPAGWSAPARNMPRTLPRPAPGAWRMSAWPGGRG
ncbi:acyl-CoA carboxylase subunit epsilon [Actinacidiphila bryophytorum]|uniref:Acyl-CoA carboxylase epsilon subunit n=1 Tax=Actinacidiphila bryophytorum TaxID=1436133 RepID=A0A9W4E0G0_9ACTN|nr:acyl-CoA carboxylase subunit epsilon [Actinacidiphila bryophytorum]MBM9436429.1 acyl-CoA carboxylase subunit epsilon [Actinacidiphila bryophytorum]MBN6546516.1 acyl-CoA carboxylase subunit epsilon [Actinacidiphila bryophytorum]CAG7601724.1 Acyl-CoA carboxylase epsilon subunit [Actinacidiphila bryophytorum]